MIKNFTTKQKAEMLNLPFESADKIWKRRIKQYTRKINELNNNYTKNKSMIR